MPVRIAQFYNRLKAVGAVFEGAPRTEAYGRVAVWRDPFGNRWDLIQYAAQDRSGTAPDKPL